MRRSGQCVLRTLYSRASASQSTSGAVTSWSDHVTRRNLRCVPMAVSPVRPAHAQKHDHDQMQTDYEWSEQLRHRLAIDPGPVVDLDRLPPAHGSHSEVGLYPLKLAPDQELWVEEARAQMCKDFESSAMQAKQKIKAICWHSNTADG